MSEEIKAKLEALLEQRGMHPEWYNGVLDVYNALKGSQQ